MRLVLLMAFYSVFLSNSVLRQAQTSFRKTILSTRLVNDTYFKSHLGRPDALFGWMFHKLEKHYFLNSHIHSDYYEEGICWLDLPFGGQRRVRTCHKLK